jgi:hypothetical protein
MAAIDAELAGRAGLPGSLCARLPDGGHAGLRKDAPAPQVLPDTLSRLASRAAPSMTR